MRILSRWSVAVVFLGVVLVCDVSDSLGQTAGEEVGAGTATAPLTLEKGWFSGTKYVHRGAEARPVYGGLGFGLDSEFKEILGEHPEAAAAAGKVKTWNIVRAVGTLGFVVFATIDLLDAIDDANKVSEGNLDINGGGTGVLDWVIAGGVMLTGHLMAGKYLNEGVSLYNEAEGFRTNAAGDPSKADGMSLRILPPSLVRQENGTALGLSVRLTR